MPFRLGAVAFFPLVLPMLRSLLRMLSAVMQPAFDSVKASLPSLPLQSMVKGVRISSGSLMKAFVKSGGTFVQA